MIIAVSVSKDEVNFLSLLYKQSKLVTGKYSYLRANDVTHTAALFTGCSSPAPRPLLVIIA